MFYRYILLLDIWLNEIHTLTSLQLTRGQLAMHSVPQPTSIGKSNLNENKNKTNNQNKIVTMPIT